MKKSVLPLVLGCFMLASFNVLQSQTPPINIPKQPVPNPTNVSAYIKSTQNAPLILSHTATGGNTLNGISQIRTEELAGIINPIIIATNIWGKSGKSYFTKPIILKSLNAGEWGIDVSNPAIPGTDFNNTDFNILVSKPNEYAFVHAAQAATISGFKTRLNHPLLNGKPDAKILITQVQVEGVRNVNPCGVLYENGSWHIVNLNKLPIPAGARYNVIVSSQIVTIAAKNPLGHVYTINDKYIPNNNPNASFFVTQVVNAGLFNPNEIGLFWVKSTPSSPTTVPSASAANSGNWAIFNQNKSFLSANTFFNVLVLEKGQATSGSDFVQGPPPLTGFVDMHTHLMSHLGFGGTALYGAPDLGILMPGPMVNCNRDSIRASTMQMALGSCNGIHGGWGTDNTCGDYLRMVIISKAMDGHFQYNADLDHPHAGYPNFNTWPHHSSILHQQMWWEWLRRAWQGGMRVMVVLAVNNELLAEGLNGSFPKDDKTTSELQIKEIKRFVKQHSDFIEIAYTPADLRRIVSAGKLAFILGIEVDNIGNFNKPGVLCDEPAVRAEIRRLYSQGIRYLFPIHVTNNKFGGSAVYSWIFNLANRYNTGSFYEIMTSPDPTLKFSYNLEWDIDGNGQPDPPAYFLENSSIAAVRALLEGIGLMPVPPGMGCGPILNACAVFRKVTDLLVPSIDIDMYKFIKGGHANKLGLTPLGEVALNEMMRLGILIDIDHMSELAQRRSVVIAENIPGGYPLNMGHNGIRGYGGKERNAPKDLVIKFSQLGGMMGVGTSDSRAFDFVVNYNYVLQAMGNRNIAFGTDANGFEPLPHSGNGKSIPNANSDYFYTSFFAESGISQRCQKPNGQYWDYIKDAGVSHYGLMPEFLHDVKKTNQGLQQYPTFIPGAQVYNNLKQSAEYFAQMWEKCERVKSNVR